MDLSKKAFFVCLKTCKKEINHYGKHSDVT